jgi:hypothetical protein
LSLNKESKIIEKKVYFLNSINENGLLGNFDTVFGCLMTSSTVHRCV